MIILNKRLKHAILFTNNKSTRIFVHYCKQYHMNLIEFVWDSVIICDITHMTDSDEIEHRVEYGVICVDSKWWR